MRDVDLVALLSGLEKRAEQSEAVCGILAKQLARQQQDVAAMRVAIQQIRERATCCPAPFWTRPAPAAA